MKNTKKIITLALAAAMLSATGITAYAVPGNTTEVSYEVAPTYTVVIPESVALGDTAVTADIEATNVLLEDGKQIKVDLTAASNTASGSTFNAKNGDSAVTYTITGDSAISVGDTVATFTANGSKTLTFSAADKSAATAAGTHTETLTFTISTPDAPAETTVTWDYAAFDVLKNNQELTKDGVTFVSNNKANSNLYDGGTHKFTATGHKIKKIEFATTSTNASNNNFSSGTVTVEDYTFYSTSDSESVNGKKVIWTGDAETVTFTGKAYAIEYITFTVE